MIATGDDEDLALPERLLGAPQARRVCTGAGVATFGYVSCERSGNEKRVADRAEFTLLYWYTICVALTIGTYREIIPLLIKRLWCNWERDCRGLTSHILTPYPRVPLVGEGVPPILLPAEAVAPLRNARDAPVEVEPAQFGGGKIAYAAAVFLHSGVVTSDGRVYTWRRGAYGRLGHNDRQAELAPKKLVRLLPILPSEGGLSNGHGSELNSSLNINGVGRRARVHGAFETQFLAPGSV